MTGVAPTVAAQESSRGDKAIATETTVVTAVSAETTQGGSLSADEQMVSELLGEQGGSFSDLPFIIVSSLPPSSSSSMQAVDAPSQAHATRDEEILAEINAEIEAAGHSGIVGGAEPSTCYGSAIGWHCLNFRYGSGPPCSSGRKPPCRLKLRGGY